MQGTDFQCFIWWDICLLRVKEAAERVRTAMRNAGYTMPAKKDCDQSVAGMCPQEGSVFDLPIAVAVLGAMGIFPEKAVEDILLAGELGLDGKLQPVEGILPIVLEAKRLVLGAV